MDSLFTIHPILSLLILSGAIYFPLRVFYLEAKVRKLERQAGLRTQEFVPSRGQLHRR